jgi:hypothetical protein
MVKNNYIISVTQLIEDIEGIPGTGVYTLFRGQNSSYPLLPKIARKDPTKDTTVNEKEMIIELKRRMATDNILNGMDEWDCLVYAQHYGLATRLLDWTTNPLGALWFAVSDANATADGFIYLLVVDESDLLDKHKHGGPFDIKSTKIIRPSVNNVRIDAQSGWFTAHPYSQKSKRFVDLHKHKDLKFRVLMKCVKGKYKYNIMTCLNKLGINQQSIFPGMEGTCRQINCEYGY